MLSVHNLTKIFPSKRRFIGPADQDFVAVNNISFEIGTGQVVGILGPNGAGKTTTIKMLLDLLTPTSGTINYFGKNLHVHRSEIMQHVAFASTYTKLPGRLSVQQNLEIYGRLYSIPITELRKRIIRYLELFGMEDRAQQEMGSLSAGQTTRVMLAKAFLVEPKILLLDEPTAALDPDIAQEVRAFIIQQQKALGMTVLLASHNMDEVSEICNRVIVLANGTIVDDNTPAHLAKSISTTKVNMIVLDGLQQIITHATANNLIHTVADRTIEIHVDEHAIAPLLAALAKLDVNYSHISITKPSLEDYFLEISRTASLARRTKKDTHGF
ncbi:MAG: ABC transporter ATP-binding protein [Candidatus Dependentiae bacterium]|nr:ABC transporter ATP-binding protein [Candidatus Dependentiae bacterium]